MGLGTGAEDWGLGSGAWGWGLGPGDWGLGAGACALCPLENFVLGIVM